MRETRSSSDSPSIDTEAASIVSSDAPSKTGMACSTVMSSSSSSPGVASQTIALAAGRVGLELAGLSPAALEGFAFAAAGALDNDTGGGLVSLSSGGRLTRAALARAAFERALPNANQASKNAATPVSVGATRCELSSTTKLS